MAKTKVLTENVDFEAALSELNQIVEKMEQGGLSLEDALKNFERGIVLTRTCQTALKAAEQKVQILLEQNGQGVLAPFDQSNTEE